MSKKVTSYLLKRVLSCCLASILVLVALSSRTLAAQANGRDASAVAKTQETSATAGDRQPSEEIEALRNELKEKPTDSASIRLGHLLLKKGDPDGAMRAFDNALRLNPRSFEARTGKGTVLVRLGEYGNAEKILRDALVLNPNPARVHYELGLLYEKQGDFGKAITEYKEGLKKYQEGRGSY